MTATETLTLFFLVFLMIILKSFNPSRSRLSDFETKRLISDGDGKIQGIIDRENTLNLLILIFEFLFLTLFSVNLLVIFSRSEVINGIVLTFVSIVLIFLLPKLPLFSNLSNRLFGVFEKSTLKFFKKRRLLFNLVAKPKAKNTDINSIEELRYVLENLPDYIADNDSRKIISSGLIFKRSIVKEFMTPLEEVKYIEKSEFLGPLVLDELHKLGHNKLPVVSKDFNQIVGILYLDKLLSLNVKKSLTAEKIMDNKVEYIEQSKTLHEALTKMLNSDLNILIVKDDKKNSGIITMRDVIEFLIGQELKAD